MTASFPSGLGAAREGDFELPPNLSDSPYYSRDMAPVPRAERRWGLKDIAVLWVSMSACIPTYMLASSLIDEGMSWWQAVLTIFLGNVIVLLPMVLNAHAGTKYGIPFPVYCRASYGILGANVPALLRRWWRAAGSGSRRGSVVGRFLRFCLFSSRLGTTRS